MSAARYVDARRPNSAIDTRLCATSVNALQQAFPPSRRRAARSIADHMRIIEALERRDTELAERLVRQHSLDLAAFVEKHWDFLE